MKSLKKAGSITLAFLLAMMLVFSMVQGVQAETLDEVLVNGENILTDTDNTLTCGNGTATYDSSTQTLTLENATLTKASGNFRVIDIRTSNPLTINLIGMNTITGAFDGIYSNSALTIKGTGSLSIHLTDIPHASAIFTGGDLTIDGATIDASITSEGSGISAETNKMIIKNAHVTSKTLHASFLAESGITITNSTVIAESTGEFSNAFFTEKGALLINDNSTVTATSQYPALWANTDINIEDSKVTATSTADWAIWSPGNLAISGDSEVIAKGETGSLGASTTFTLSPKQDEYVEAFSGDDENSATALQGSPFSGKTDIKALNIGKKVYFHSKPHIHTYETTWSKDETSHWHECTANDSHKTDLASHTFGEWVIDTPATETAVGSKHRDCTVCEQSETEKIPALPHTHIAGTEWLKDATNHWHECTAGDGEKMDLTAHTFGEWVIDTPATETAAGSKHRDCTVCEQSETAEIPATGESPEKPVITAGAGASHVISNGKDMTLTCSGKLEDLTGVYVDDKLIDESNYTLKSGSTILTLKASYLDTLSVGKHTLKFQYKDNVSAETDFTITKKTEDTPSTTPSEPIVTPNTPSTGDTPNSPQTGDSSNTMLYLGLIVLSGCAIGFGLKKKKALNK